MRSAPAAALGLALLAAGIAAAPAPADTFVLVNREEVDGYLFGRGLGPAREWIIQTTAGQRRYNEGTVKEVRPSANPEADFKRYFGVLGKKDAAVCVALGRWAKERGIPDRAKEAFEKALALKPDVAGAHEGLGHVLVGDEWVPAEEAESRRRDLALKEGMAAKYKEALGGAPEVVLTAHWRIVDFLEDKKAKDRAKDMEAAFAEGVRVFGSDPWNGRAFVVACSGMDQYLKWLDLEVKSFPGMNKGLMDFYRASTGMKFTEPAVLGRSDLPDKGAMHAAFVHTAGHILLNNWKAVNRTQPFWIEEGFGGWMEDAILKTNSSYCFGRGKPSGYGVTVRNLKDWETDKPDWKELVKNAAAHNEFIPLDQLDSLGAGEYTRREVGQAFSFVAFLLKTKDLERFRDYVSRIKAGGKSPAAFQKAYDYTFESIEPEWKTWVQSGAW
jgi:hypothetical protein